MKITSKIAGLLVLMFAVAFVGCNNKNKNNNGNMQNQTGNNMQMSQNNNGNNQKVNANNSDFMANLTGSNQVPSVNTNASGKAYFKVNKDSSKIMYTVQLSNADSVIMAHIHYGAKGKNGPPVVWLYPSPSNHNQKVKKGTVNGVLKSGSFDSTNFVGPMKGKSITDLVHAIKHDSAYVNVHNKAHQNGLIRGQVKAGGMNNNMNNNNM
jgi:hypothetical protein